MRSSAVIITISVLASVAPSLALRQGSPYARDEASALFERDDLTSRGFWKDFGHGFVKGFTGTAKVLAPVATAFLKREDIELLGRDIANQAPGDHEAQALSWNSVNDFFKGAGQVIESVTPFIQAAAPHLKGREISDALYARAAHQLRDDIVERGFWKDFGNGFVKGFTGTAKVIAPVATAFLKRDELEFLARELESRELEARSMFEDDLLARSLYDLD